ncbi:MAG: Ig-like domain-containing protein, partial [Candidatus Cyclobacteriaceae bacterium M3_2C_046]
MVATFSKTFVFLIIFTGLFQKGISRDHLFYENSFILGYDYAEKLIISKNENRKWLNEPPAVQDQSYDILKNEVLTISLWANDPDGDSLTLSIVNNPKNGTLGQINEDYTVEYEPDQDYTGKDTLTYIASDGATGSAPGTIIISITNGIPVVSSFTINTDKNTPIDIILTGSDPDGDELTFETVASTTNGGLTSVDAQDNSVTYSPNTEFTGSDSFTFIARDDTVNSNEATVTINVLEPPNTAPVATSQTMDTDSETPVVISLSATDDDGDDLSFEIVAVPDHGTLSEINAIDNSVTYTPDGIFTGQDVFTFIANDGKVNSNEATVTVNINPGNTAPVAENLELEINKNTSTKITFIGSDTDDDNITFSIVSPPEHGSLGSINMEDNTISYTPDSNYIGNDSFTYIASDGSLNSTQATVSIQIINNPPIAEPISITLKENESVNIGLVGNDADGDALVYALVDDSDNGVISDFDANLGTLIYAPKKGFFGSDSFTFKINDGLDDSNTATVSLTVEEFNTAPDAYDQDITINEDTPQEIQLTFTDTDGDGSISFAHTDPAHGNISEFNLLTGFLVYTPDGDYFGSDSFTYTVNDGELTSSPATISITINPVNDAPLANGQSVTTTEDVTKAITLTGSDLDNDPITFAIVQGPGNGTLENLDVNTGEVDYIPNLNFNGSDSFTFKVNDGTVDSNPATVNITVDPVNDKPIANNQNVATPEDQAKEITLTGSDVDQDDL